jgi:hypothetical protein
VDEDSDTSCMNSGREEHAAAALSISTLVDDIYEYD